MLFLMISDSKTCLSIALFLKKKNRLLTPYYTFYYYNFLDDTYINIKSVQHYLLYAFVRFFDADTDNDYLNFANKFYYLSTS